MEDPVAVHLVVVGVRDQAGGVELRAIHAGEGNPAAAETPPPLEAWEQANQEELANCRLGTRCWDTGGICSVGRTIRLTSTLEELPGDDRRERAQSESSA